MADEHRFSWWAVEWLSEPPDRTRAIPFVQLERLWRRDDVAVRRQRRSVERGQFPLAGPGSYALTSCG